MNTSTAQTPPIVYYTPAGDSAPRKPGADQRRAAMQALITERGSMRVDDLASAFDVSVMTVHRDLDTLAKEERIERVRGGARAVSSPFLELDVAVRKATNVEIKEQLSAVAAELISPGDVVALDDSTTVGAIAPHLLGRSPAAVITHSLNLINTLVSTQVEFPIIGLGGTFQPETMSFLGGATLDQMKGLSADISIVSTTALRAGALFHPDESAARTKTGCVHLGARRVLVADSSKCGASGLHQVVPLSAFTDIIIDSHVTDEYKEQLVASGAAIHIVETPAPHLPPR